MSTNAYGVETTADLREQGKAARDLINEAAVAWDNFVRDATGAEYDGTDTGARLSDANDAVDMDLGRLLD